MSSEINQALKQILTRNHNHTGKAIQEMFNLMANEQLKDGRQSIQKAILFSMETMHQWSNITKYSQEWDMEDFRKGLVVRMKRRLKLNDGEMISSNTKEQLSKLISLYEQVVSPKKPQNKYIQKIINQSPNLEKIQNNEVIQNHKKSIQSFQSEYKPIKMYPKIDLSRIMKKNKLELELNKETKSPNQPNTHKRAQVKELSKKSQQRSMSSQRLCKIIKKRQQNEQPNPQGASNLNFKFDSNKKSDKKVSISKLTKPIKYDPSEVNTKFYSFSKPNGNQSQPQNQISKQPFKPLVVVKIKQPGQRRPSLQKDNFDSFKKETNQYAQVDSCQTRLLIRQISKQLKEEKESKQSNEQPYLRQSSSKNKKTKESFYNCPNIKQDLYANLTKINDGIKSQTAQFFNKCFE